MKSCLLSLIVILALVSGCTEKDKSASASDEGVVIPAPEAVEEIVVEETAEPVKQTDVVAEPVEVKPPVQKPEVVVEAVEAVAEEATEAEIEEAVPAPAADEVLATVNGQPIMKSVVDEFLKPQLAKMKMMGRPPTESILNNFRKRVIDGMVREILIEAAVKSKGIVVSDEEVSAKLTEIAEQRGVTVEKLIETAASQGYTEEKIKSQIRVMGLGFDKLMDIEAGENNLEVTEEDARKFYDENISKFSSPDLVKTSHILAGGRGFDSFDEEKRTAAKAKIEEVKKKLDAGGNFEELAKEYSDCPSKNNDSAGDLEVYISKAGEVNGRPAMDKTFSEAAHTLETGGITDIVKTPFGYHIIKCTDKKAAEVMAFEDVKDSIIEREGAMKRNEFATGYIDKLLSGAEVVYADAPKIEVAAPKAPAGVEVAPAKE